MKRWRRMRELERRVAALEAEREVRVSGAPVQIETDPLDAQELWREAVVDYSASGPYWDYL